MKPRRHKIGLMLMKSLTGLLICAALQAQSPERMSYQAVVRNASGELITKQSIGVRTTILRGSTIQINVYQETYSPNPSTNENGLLTLEIGSGQASIGVFSEIDWSNGPYFLRTEMDPSGGASYSIAGTSQILSVPFALHAKKAENFTETDPVFGVSPAAGITGTNITNWNTAFGWGNHSGLYRPVSWVPSWADVTGKPATFPPSAHSHSAVDITSGTLNIARIPTGTTSSTVSLGNHTHGNITNTGSIGSASGRIVTTGASGALQATAGTTAGQMLYWNGSAWINVEPGTTGQVLTFVSGVPTWKTQPLAGDVLNPATGKIWMDRNLGATQVATSSTDAASYGYLYQWGRGTDGHQIRTSGTTGTLSSTDSPGHGNFILAPNSPYDWRSPQNNSLWQGGSGINNPCPSGYRLPTDAEWNAERLSWSSNNAADAFASPLKLPVAGSRSSSDGSLSNAGSYGYYWSSTISSAYSRGLLFGNTYTSMSTYNRAYGFSVRCLKN